MVSKVVALVALFCIFQGFECRNSDNGDQATRNLERELKNAYDVSRHEYNDGRQEIRRNVYQAMRKTDGRIRNLLSEAHHAGNWNCDRNLKISLRTIHSTTLRNCYANDDLNYAEREINAINNLIREARNLSKKCKESDDDYEACVESGSRRIREGAGNRQRNAREGLRKARENSGECVDRTDRELDEKVDGVEKEFKNCIAQNRYH